MSRKLDLVIRCSHCKGTLIWQEQNGEVIVFHNCKGGSGTPVTRKAETVEKGKAHNFLDTAKDLK